MLLVNVQSRHPTRVDTNTENSIQDCLQEALRRFPFVSEAERKKVVLRTDYDFNFNGSRILFVHVIFNLLKNAIYFLTKAGKGEILIWAQAGKRADELHFKDTSVGIAPEELSKLFSLFYSTTPNGTGIGLSFCKTAMHSLGGGIQCRSELGEYTEFILSFPRKTRDLNLGRIENYQPQQV
ncbi:MAG: ATP-binding protein [Legionellales bacterium]|nr:ATP-binding protein [Legionellales bacterium]